MFTHSHMQVKVKIHTTIYTKTYTETHTHTQKKQKKLLTKYTYIQIITDNQILILTHSKSHTQRIKLELQSYSQTITHRRT